MTRRAAITIAGVLIGSMMAGFVALTLGRGLVGAPAAGATVAPKPIVKTETRVVTIHKKRPAKPAPAQTITVVRPGSGSSSMSSPSSSGSHGYEDDGGDSHERGGGGDD